MYEFHIVSLYKLKLHFQIHDGLCEVRRQFQLSLTEVHLIPVLLLLLLGLLLLEYGEHAGKLNIGYT